MGNTKLLTSNQSISHHGRHTFMHYSTTVSIESLSAHSTAVKNFNYMRMSSVVHIPIRRLKRINGNGRKRDQQQNLEKNNRKQKLLTESVRPQAFHLESSLKRAE